MLISEAFEMYRMEHIVFRNQSVRTEEMHLYVMGNIIDFNGDIPIEDLTFDMIRSWSNNIRRSRGANTVRGYVIKLRVVLKHIRAHGHRALDPEIIGVPKRENKPVDYITPEDVSRLINAVVKPQSGYSTHNRLRNGAIVSLLYSSGIRVTELCNLNQLSIREDGTFTVVGKGGKPRLCFMDDRTAELLRIYLAYRNDDKRPLFLAEQTNQRISKGTVEIIFRYAKDKAGFEKRIYPHILRHSFATNLLKNNTNIVYVRDLLGHASVQTTEMYMHVVDKDLQNIYNSHHTY